MQTPLSLALVAGGVVSHLRIWSTLLSGKSLARTVTALSLDTEHNTESDHVKRKVW